MALELHQWETFYVIVGSSAAALTGLQFVVIALLKDSESVTGSEESLQAFATPTIVHFCSVLLISAMASMPGHTATTLAASCIIGGLAGAAYAISVTLRARRQTTYQPVFEDWLFHSALPMIAYAVLLIAGITAFHHATGAMYFVAAVSLMLLFIGIHNAWDTAVWIATPHK